MSTIPRLETHYVAKLDPERHYLHINDYELQCLLGKGSYADVILARHIPSDTLVAMKRFSKARLSKKRNVHRDSVSGEMKVETALDKVENEVSILQKLDHPNIIRLLSAIDDPDKDEMFYVFEYADSGALMTYDQGTFRYSAPKELATSTNCFDERVACFVIFDILQALELCHRSGIVHRDMKPENIFMTHEGFAKLGDFGVSYDRNQLDNQALLQIIAEEPTSTEECTQEMAILALQKSKSNKVNVVDKENKTDHDEDLNDNQVDDQTKDQTDDQTDDQAKGKDDQDHMQTVPEIQVGGTEGTFHFVAPEAFRQSYYDGCAADMWALGITLYVMLFGQVPFGWDARDPISLFDAIETATVPETLPSSISKECDAFLRSILHKDPKQRLTAYNALNHPWIVEHINSEPNRELRHQFPLVNISKLSPFRTVSMSIRSSQHTDSKSVSSPVPRMSHHSSDASSIGLQIDSPTPAHTVSEQDKNQIQYTSGSNRASNGSQLEQFLRGTTSYTAQTCISSDWHSDEIHGRSSSVTTNDMDSIRNSIVSEKHDDNGISVVNSTNTSTMVDDCCTNRPLDESNGVNNLGSIILRGYLHKRGRIRKSWQRRYIILSVKHASTINHSRSRSVSTASQTEDVLHTSQNNSTNSGNIPPTNADATNVVNTEDVTKQWIPVLTYFKDESCQSFRGEMLLDDLHLVAEAPKSRKPFRFFVQTTKRTMYLQASNAESFRLWLLAFNMLSVHIRSVARQSTEL